MDDVDGSVLCLSCGMCCDGSIFRAVQLRPDEMDEARRHQVRLIDKADRASGDAAMEEPCVLFQGGCCSTYGEWRPRACDDYRCGVLADYVARRRSLEESQTLLASYRAARTKLDGVDDARILAGDLPVDQLLALAVLKVLRHRHFTHEPLEAKETSMG
ncbi:MAG: YkgJ family cysteine cluster protein [Ilumatobacteraceae bacterium]